MISMNDPIAQMIAHAEAMNAYRQLTQDQTFGSRVNCGKAQLVRVTYDAKGKSTVTPCSEWVPVNQWLSKMAEWSAA